MSIFTNRAASMDINVVISCLNCAITHWRFLDFVAQVSIYRSRLHNNPKWADENISPITHWRHPAGYGCFKVIHEARLQGEFGAHKYSHFIGVVVISSPQWISWSERKSAPHVTLCRWYYILCGELHECWSQISCCEIHDNRCQEFHICLHTNENTSISKSVAHTFSSFSDRQK